MEPSAETSKADQARALIQLVGAFVHFDCPSPGFQPSGLFQCVGWVLKAHADDTIEFKINGVAVDQVHWHDRPDAARDYPEMHTAGFTFWVDVNGHVGPESKALALTAHVNGPAVGTRYLRVLREDDARTKTLFYFLHVPKTGGTAVLSRLREATANLKLLEVYDYEGAFTPDQLRVLSPRSLQKFDLIYGHFDYGMHVICENPHRYLTILRDPFDFVVSQYFFPKYVLREPLHTNQRSIFDFLRNNPGHLDNSFCRILCGDIPFDQPLTHADYDRALANMDRDFAFVGMRERLPESMAQISGLLGVNLVNGLRGENITPATPERANLDMRALRAATEDRLQYDLMLYEEVGRRYFGLGPKRRAEAAARNVLPTPHHNGEVVESTPRSSEPVIFAAIEAPLEALSGPGRRAQGARGAAAQGDEASTAAP